MLETRRVAASELKGWILTVTEQVERRRMKDEDRHSDQLKLYGQAIHQHGLMNR